MKEQEWNKVYAALIRWAIRRMSKDSLKFYGDKRSDWIKCLLLLDEFEGKLYKTLPEIGEDFEITADEFSKLCHEYISKHKVYTIKFFFFTLWTDCRHYLENTTYNFTSFIKPATKEEIEQARKDFSEVTDVWYNETHTSKHTFNDDAKVIEYRGLRLIVDNEWGDAWIKHNDEIRHFQLIWDWYYPIDEFIDLEK